MLTYNSRKIRSALDLLNKQVYTKEPINDETFLHILETSNTTMALLKNLMYHAPVETVHLLDEIILHFDFDEY
ncbi:MULTISPECIES: hypothetical protein [unclassified Fusibacter]|uniref:hypothetical protein n=1 Tax=unclassified Fusibacter TaxID=2624464 RepID=UPI0010112705|nr:MULTISPECIES: hypothetical protein [unclassified Fusibacter]MCK8058355.1 hypothetical protein [Fusibacter sp. A2]NPE20938.1 hypothetical protein [Fusibacter sp. A1]RXV63140.1 hypothetical protein DWB64_03810 [Fusibacter sp. A1]